MPRPLRIEYPGAWYYVTNSGAAQQSPFLTDHNKQLFLAVLNEVVQLYGIEIHAYCLFNTHYHLLIRTPDQPLSSAMRHINSVYTQRYQLHHNVTGPLFKGRYKSVLLDEATGYVQRLGRFIHRLPQLYRFKPPLFKFEWSSYQAYIQERPKPDWLKVSYLLSYYHGDHKLKSFYTYTESSSDPELVSFYKKKKWKSQLGTPPITITRPPSNEIKSMDMIIKSTATIFNETRLDIVESRRGRGNQQLGRTVAMYLCRHVGHFEIKDIAKVFNVSHFSTVTVRLKRFQSVLDENTELQHKLKLLKQTVGQFKVCS
jgi:putative transposase